MVGAAAGALSPDRRPGCSRSRQRLYWSTMEIFIALVLIVALAVGAMYLSRFLLKRAIRTVVATFRGRGAVSAKKAATAESLGLARGGVMDRMFRMRDYRPDALRLLAQAGIVKTTEDGRLYLSEEELGRSTVKKITGGE